MESQGSDMAPVIEKEKLFEVIRRIEYTKLETQMKIQMGVQTKQIPEQAA
jgi:hypothetical protein